MNDNENNNNSNTFKLNIPYPRNNVFAVLSLIFGILSILCCCLWYLGIASSIIAVVFFIIDRKKNSYSNNIAIAALICAIAGFILTLATFISNNIFYEQLTSFLLSLYEKL